MDLIQFLYLAVALLITLSVHESSHALVAYYLGDPTAKMRGRLTLNPFAHLDVMGTIIFLVTQRIGWGKPVPINPNNFQNPQRDSALTAFAGPFSNFLLAFLIALPLKHLAPYMPEVLHAVLWTTFNVSIFLGIFNMFPFPPLDGSQIIGFFVPKKYERQYRNFLENGLKYFVAIILIDVFILGQMVGFSFFGYAIRFLHGKISLLLLLGT